MAKKSTPTRLPKTEDVAAAVKKTLEKNLEAMEKEDLAMTMSTVHPQSPVYAPNKKITKKLMEVYDLKYEIVSFSYIGRDNLYAVVRVKQKATKVKGPAFRNNMLDAMHIFRKDKGVWKIWQTTILEIKFLKNNPKPKQ
ncbi:MAG: hypothetical protein K8S55_03555 [Phycisphaerae bacterium]|nr:hypothetical protein [Phycisphaerae bacterium]